MCHITTEVNEKKIKEVAYNFGVEDIIQFWGCEVHAPDVYMVFLNGR